VSFATVNYLGDGASGQSASHDGEDLNMSWPSNRVDPPTLLLLHVSGGVGLLASHCSSPGGPCRGVATEGTLGRARRSHMSW
jgi:hypothetical protein